MIKIIDQSVEILHYTSDMLKHIELCGRCCYKSENKIGRATAAAFVKNLIASRHGSVLEHGTITIKAITDRGVTHELVRHRLASYSQESTRFCSYSGGLTFIRPIWVSPTVLEELPNMESLPESDYVWLTSMQKAANAYHNLLSHGWRPEQARQALPASLKTEIVVTANVREWRHILGARTNPKAHPQMKDLAFKILAIFRDLVPVLFNDI